MTENNMVRMGEKPILPLGFLKWTTWRSVCHLARGHAGPHRLSPILAYVPSEKHAHVFNESSNWQNALKFLTPQNKNVYIL